MTLDSPSPCLAVSGFWGIELVDDVFYLALSLISDFQINKIEEQIDLVQIYVI